MDGSIAHPDPAARRAALEQFLGVLESELHEAAAKEASPDIAASLREFLQLMRSIDASSVPPRSESEHLAVCRHWEASLEDGAPRPLVAALGALGPWLSWTQNPNYRRRPPDPTFLENYGYAVVAGPLDGPSSLAAAADLALGVLLLGPGAHYPLHAHPAVEIYYTLTRGGEWWRDDGPWRREPAGAVIHHAPNVRHATRAGASPLLAIYLWRGELGTHARLTERRPAG